MDRSDKAEFIEDIKGQFAKAPLLILTDYKGSTPFQLDKVRRGVEKAGAKFRIVKNTLARKAIAESDTAPLSSHFKGNIGVVFAGEDPSAAVKVFLDLRKENDKLAIRAGFFEGTVLDVKGVEAVASLPSREELLSSLLATVLSAPQSVLGVIGAPGRDLMNLLSNYATKLEEGE